jgi:REP element-mobilizing transposase RayT
MPSRLKRYQQTRQLHYVTFTCFRRQEYLGSGSARDVFEQTLERVRRWYNFYIVGYVGMPERVRLLVSEPERSSLAVALQMLKQVSSRKLHDRSRGKAFWRGITISMYLGSGSEWKSCVICIGRVAQASRFFCSIPHDTRGCPSTGNRKNLTTDEHG